MAPLSVACGKRVARRLGAAICFEDECGLTLRPAKARTWAPRGQTPLITVSGAGGRRISVAGMVCYRPNQPGRLLYRILVHQRRKGVKQAFTEDRFASMIDAAHQYPGTPIVLVWDGLPAHRSALMRQMIAARPWLRIYPLPAYAPELNPSENVWSTLRRGLGNLAAGKTTDLVRIAKNRLKKQQYHTGLIDGNLAATDLSPP